MSLGSLRFYIPMAIVQFLSWGAMFALWVFAFPHVRAALGVDEAGAIHWVGLGLALYVALGAAINFALPWAYRRIGSVATHGVALGIGGSGLIMVAHAATPLLLLMGYALTGFGWASISSTPYVLVNDRVTDGRYQLAMARFNLSVVVPQICIALALGWLTHAVDPMTAILIGGHGMLLAAGITLILLLPGARLTK